MSARMHADQVDVDEELVRRLLAEQMPDWAGLPLTPVAEQGTDHALFRLGTGLVVRLPVIGWANGQAALEAAWLPRLAPHLPLEVSVPQALGDPGLGYPFRWSVHPWLTGDRLDPASVVAVELARDLAGFVRALRSCDTTGAGQFGSRGGPLSEPERDRGTRSALAAAGDVIDADAALAVWEGGCAAPEHPGPPTWFHGDLTAGNLLVRDGRLSGVLDWGPCGVGDPAVELHAAYQLFERDARVVFHRELDVDDATWARARAWAVSIAAMEIAYYRRTRPEFVSRSTRAIEQVLADPMSGGFDATASPSRSPQAAPDPPGVTRDLARG
jgi:aminoglycoside phosphotransferase (APT) family kinase protein